MVLHKGDFIELRYTGKLADTKEVFDTTEADVPHEHTHGHSHEPAIVCLGHNQLLPGIDHFLIGKELGKHRVDLEPDMAFGKRLGDLVQLIPTIKFLKQEMRPYPGLRVTIDGTPGTILTVSGGRTIVDFNHPLAGKKVSYDLNVTRKVDKKDEQIAAAIKRMVGVPADKVTMDGAEKATALMPFKVPQEVVTMLANQLKEMTGVVVTFDSKKEPEAKTTAKPAEHDHSHDHNHDHGHEHSHDHKH